jgi:hypothetical protein
MEPIFILCHVEEYTPEKVILYVKNLGDVQQSDWIASGVNHATEYSVHGVTLLEGHCTGVDVYGATHKVTAVRHSAPKSFGVDLPAKGEAFYLISRAVGEFEEGMKRYGMIPVDSPNSPALTVQVLREIVAGLDNSAPWHYSVRCTPEQRRTLSLSMIEDAERAGLIAVPDEYKDKGSFSFVQWGTGASLYFEDANYFAVSACKIRERSIIGVDEKYTHDAMVLRIEGNDVYVRAYTNDVRKDPHMGGEYKWEGKFIVLNY